MNRRQFAFWLGLGLFSLGERLGIRRLDAWAADVMEAAARERWSVRLRGNWQWYQRDQWIDGRWQWSAMTRPRRVDTGELYKDDPRYIDESLVPAEMRSEAFEDGPDDTEPGEVSQARKARHGRPPSRWLRRLDADELRTWLRTVELPEYGVAGMTFWTHLTRDHYFSPQRIEGLEEDELAKLHAAAHSGY